MKPKKIKLRKRIFIAFSTVLFVSFFLTGIIINVAINLYAMEMAQGINFMSIILIGTMFFVSVIASFFLANSITKPIEKLSKFALGIGGGNFEPNNFEFNDEELEELSAALNKSVVQLGIYDREQKAFFQNVSHELRTPLMSIKCYAEGISFDVMDPKHASETILQETDRLSDLVTDLLYIAKMDNIATAYKKEKVDLLEIVKNCMERHLVFANKKGLKLSFKADKEPIYYECAKELILRAIDNLISNAIRYAKSEIVLSCTKNAKQIEITVANDGLPVDTEDMPHIFKRFYKGKDGNNGIGLSIVKSAVEQHKGKVFAKNSDKVGVVFTITLPV
ncbi:MAG: HAMP domain-containing histidine kinase [Defluviitaleaceae bacterium]|nr:HAMP domain-containing histidine kinase [Defluviitaleaceae bacterium]